MKEYLDDKWGLKTLTGKETQIRGGLSFKELWEFLTILGEAVKQAEKYWPRFKKGFVAGWEGA
jgi:hypothetical protein